MNDVVCVESVYLIFLNISHKSCKNSYSVDALIMFVYVFERVVNILLHWSQWCSFLMNEVVCVQSGLIISQIMHAFIFSRCFDNVWFMFSEELLTFYHIDHNGVHSSLMFLKLSFTLGHPYNLHCTPPQFDSPNPDQDQGEFRKKKTQKKWSTLWTWPCTGPDISGFPSSED